MDSFTIAVVVGIGAVLFIFLGLVLVDKGAPEATPSPKSRSKKSS